MRQPTSDSAEFYPETADAVRAELELVLKSQPFRRSERHSRFLRFVCESTLAGDASRLNEYLIAHEVFDRGPDFSPGEDSVVRRQAYSLRQKLQEYYNTAGKGDLVRIELPVGHYVPTFAHRQEPTFSEPAPVAPAMESDVPARPEPETEGSIPANASQPALWRKWIPVLLAVAAVSAVLGWVASRQSLKREMALDPIFTEIWGPWLSSSEGAVICFSNALTAGIRQADEPFPDDNVTRGVPLDDEEAQQIRRQFHLPPGGYFYINPGLAHAKMGEALGSIPLTAMFTKAGVPVQATQSRYVNWQDFRNQNIILLGHREANRWLDPILSTLPLRQGRTQADKPRRIVNTSPRSGERAEYYPDYSKGHNPPAEDFALISFLSSIDGRHSLALINGVNTEGTLMALDFMTDAASLRVLQAALEKAHPKRQGVRHFQAILHSDLRDGVPTGIEVVLVRDLP